MHFSPAERLLDSNKAALMACISPKLTRSPLENEHMLILAFLITLKLTNYASFCRSQHLNDAVRAFCFVFFGNGHLYKHHN